MGRACGGAPRARVGCGADRGQTGLAAGRGPGRVPAAVRRLGGHGAAGLPEAAGLSREECRGRQRQRMVMTNPIIMIPKPMARFQLPMPGIGQADWAR